MIKRALMVVAKQPAVGQTKTRLCPPLSGEEASACYECLLRDTLDLIRAARQQIDLDPIVCYLPAGGEAYFRAVAPDFSLQLQQGRDLSQRLAHATTTVLTEFRYDQVVIMDSDSPTLSPGYVCQAFTILDSADISLGPCDDGGYYLIGLKRPVPDLFLKVQMSTPQVVGETLAVAHALGLQVCQLPSSFDIDYVADLRRLSQELEQLPDSVAAHSRAFLKAHGEILARGQ
jgi:rSAM/selenodomain-associated transferase 1